MTHAHIWHYDPESSDLRFDPEFFPSAESAGRHLRDIAEPGLVMMCENNPGPTSAECRYLIVPTPSKGDFNQVQFHPAQTRTANT